MQVLWDVILCLIGLLDPEDQWHLNTQYHVSCSPSGPSKHTPRLARCFVPQSRVHPTGVHEGPDRVNRGIALLSLTSALDRGGWLTPRPTRFTLREKLTGHQVLSGRVRKISSLPGFEPRTVQLVASCYID